MTTTIYTTAPVFPAELPTKGAGSMRFQRAYAVATLGTQYDTGGNEVALPDAPDGYDLWCVVVLNHNLGPGLDVWWNQSPSAPKLLVYDEDNTSGIAAELADNDTNHAAKILFLELIYKSGF